MAVETATPPQRALRRRRRLAGAAALAAAGLAVALAPAAASAQSLRELYEAAHAYDATYLAARALADSATYRVEQTRALEPGERFALRQRRPGREQSDRRRELQQQRLRPRR